MPRNFPYLRMHGEYEFCTKDANCRYGQESATVGAAT